MDEQYRQTAPRRTPYDLYTLTGQTVTARDRPAAHADDAILCPTDLGEKVSCGG